MKLINILEVIEESTELNITFWGNNGLSFIENMCGALPYCFIKGHSNDCIEEIHIANGKMYISLINE